MQHDQVQKKLNGDLLTPPEGRVEGVAGGGGQIFSTMLLHLMAIF